MLKRILTGYITIIGSILRVCLLGAICIGASALIVWPLWKLATTNPAIYTTVFTAVFSLLVFWIAGTRLRLAYRRNPRTLIQACLRILILLSGLTGAILLVLAWHRLAALFVLLITIAGYGFVAFGLSTDSRNT